MRPASIPILALLFTVGLASTLRAESWTPFFMSPNDTEVWIDRQSVRIDGSHRRVKARLWFGGGPEDMPLMDRGVARIDADIDVDCRARTTRAISRRYFDKAGAPVLILDDPQMPGPPAPGSFEDALSKTYCR